MSSIIPMLTDEALAENLKAFTAEIERRKALPKDASTVLPIPVYRVTLDILDLDRIRMDTLELVRALGNIRIELTSIVEIKRKDLVEEWYDEHPFNQMDSRNAALDAHFEDAPVVWKRD